MMRFTRKPGKEAVMEKIIRARLTRRDLQRWTLVLPAPLVLALAGRQAAGIAFAQSDATATVTPALVPTPSCADDDDLEETPEQTEGPFFTPDSPERTSLLEPEMPGTKLTLAGYVYTTDCQPVPGALLDFWQADDAGAYDNEGYRLRGHQFTDDDGRFELTTIMPGLYSGRTRHIHVKAQAPDQPVLTTQLYFPDEPANERDGIFDPALLVELREEETQLASFNFVLETA